MYHPRKSIKHYNKAHGASLFSTDNVTLRQHSGLEQFARVSTSGKILFMPLYFIHALIALGSNKGNTGARAKQTENISSV